MARESVAEREPRTRAGGRDYLIGSAYHAVLAVKDEREDALAACGGLRSLTAARAVIREFRAIPPETLEDLTMAYNRTRAFRMLNVRSDSGAIENGRLQTSGLVADADARYTPLSDEDLIDAALQVVAKRLVRGSVLESPRATREYLILRLAPLEHEVFCCIFLDNRHRIIAFEELFRGTVDGASVHPREVVKRALTRNAAAVILAHNHPSGMAEPSQADELITARLREALSLVDTRLLDHLVVGGKNVVSLAERGLI